MISIANMKTTVDIEDRLLDQAKRHARETGRHLEELVEEGLRHVLSKAGPDGGYRLPDCSVGDARHPDPTERYSWAELRSMIYGESEQR